MALTLKAWQCFILLFFAILGMSFIVDILVELHTGIRMTSLYDTKWRNFNHSNHENATINNTMINIATTKMITRTVIKCNDTMMNNNNNTNMKDTKRDNKHFDDYFELLSSVILPQNRNITVVINSCGRLDLLNRTLSSFMRYYPHKKYPIYEKILIDDCRNESDAIQIIKQYFKNFEIVLTSKQFYESRYGEDFHYRDYRITNAINKVLVQVESQWIYHLEDDWEFNRFGFIDQSFDVFQAALHKNNTIRIGIVICWDSGSTGNTRYHFKNRTSWTLQKYGDLYGGFTFNAGLFPKFLFDRYKPFNWNNEPMVSDKFKQGSMRIAKLLPGACEHIGGGDRHVVKEGPQDDPY